MSVGEIHINDTGTIFKATIKDSNAAVVDISAASAIQFTFYKPDKTKLITAATLTNTGTDGLMQYTTVSGDINVLGIWKFQGYVKTDATHWYYTDIQSFKVYDNLDY